MSRDEAIIEFYNSQEFTDFLNKMNPPHLRDDLKGEVMIVLCEQEPEFIEELHKRGQLRFWAIRVIINMVKSETSGFYRKYRKQFVNIEGYEECAATTPFY